MQRTIENTVNVCSGYRYQDPLQSILTRFKFEAYWAIAPLIQGLLAQDHNFQKLMNADWIILVPSHKNRIKKRDGFHLEKIFEKYLDPSRRFMGLTRIKDTPPLFDLSPAERKAALEGAFHLHDTHLLEGKSVLLLDDILTTGATLAAIGSLISTTKIKSISAYTLASVEE